MIKHKTILIFALSLVVAACAQNNTAANTTNKDGCTDRVGLTAVEIPMPITMTDRLRENITTEQLKNEIMSGQSLDKMLKAQNFYKLFEEDMVNNERVKLDGFGSLYYQSKANKNFIIFDMGRGFYLRYFDYIFDEHNILPNQSLFSETDKKEIISVINIITNSSIKSAEILSNLEQIYQTKLDSKVLLAQEIIAANVEYQVRLFELRGIYIDNNSNIECRQNRLTTFSVT